MRNKLGQFVKGHSCSNTGKTHWKKGESPNSFKGKHLPQEIRDKISKANKGKRNSPATEFQKGIHPKTEFKKGMKGEKCCNWRGGISFEPYSIDWTETLKRSIRERDHHICQLCNLYGNIVHHIDYDKKNCNPDNLITLCRKCHTKTNNNRKYWINYFSPLE